MRPLNMNVWAYQIKNTMGVEDSLQENSITFITLYL